MQIKSTGMTYDITLDRLISRICDWHPTPITHTEGDVFEVQLPRPGFIRLYFVDDNGTRISTTASMYFARGEWHGSAPHPTMEG